MSLGTYIQGALIGIAGVAGAVYLFDNRDKAADPMPAVEIEPDIPGIVSPVPSPVQTSASVVSIPRQKGQFFTIGRISSQNGSGSVRFLVDTGASIVALTALDARKAGIKPEQLTYNMPIQTANGQTYAARVILKDVAVGGIRIRNVEAVVVREGLEISLLGMTFLGELQKVEATPQQLILRY